MQGTIKSSRSRALVTLGGAFPGPAVCHRCKARAADGKVQGDQAERTKQAIKYIFLRKFMHNTGEEKSAFPESFLPVPSS